MEKETQKKPRILCLHGYRTSGTILKKLIERWPQTVLNKLDLVYLDGPIPARGKSDVEDIFDPPYYEWFHSKEDFTEYFKFDECMTYIENYMVANGHFDGVLGFSQGAILAAAFQGMQKDGACLTKVPKIKFVIIISGARFAGIKFGLPKLAANAYSSLIDCPSLHFLGEADFLKENGNILLESFINHVVIHHNRGHTIPRLDGENLEKMLGFIENILRILP